MKNVLRVILALGLPLVSGGCTEADWANVLSYRSPQSQNDAFPPAVTTPTAAATTSAASEKCSRTAHERAGDTSNQGFDDDTAQRVYQATYADCMHGASQN